MKRRDTMNTKGQAALEYLMTYGWALIVIAIVVGVLIFIVSSPAGSVTCSSSDPTKILLKSANIPALAVAATPGITGVINVQNATGGPISTVTVTAGTGQFSGTDEILCTSSCTAITPGTGCTAPVCADDTALATVVSGGNVYIYPKYAATQAVGALPTSSYTVTYNDQFNYAKTVTLTCQGNVPA
jgi:uncharacterized protein (UPF0333 family)